jgi:predicted nucleic acid-binding Zn ribbon protein
MSFNSLPEILEHLEKQAGWERHQQYRHLLQCWTAVVEPPVALQTRPLYIARQVLWVATSSSAWAQTLSLQRYFLLKKLNTLLREPLTDIRFSSAHWHDRLSDSTDEKPGQMSPVEKHPSLVDETLPPSSTPERLMEDNTLDAVFARWTEVVRSRSQSLPLCPQCQCPTPVGELERWTVCACCAAQLWSSNRQKNSKQIGSDNQ